MSRDTGKPKSRVSEAYGSSKRQSRALSPPPVPLRRGRKEKSGRLVIYYFLNFCVSRLRVRFAWCSVHHMDKEFISAKTAAAILGIHPATLWRDRLAVDRRYPLPAAYVEGRPLYREHDMRSYSGEVRGRGRPRKANDGA